MNPGYALTILVYPAAPTDSTHQYLLLRRIQPRGGFWQGITGAVELGEALDDAAVRELSEQAALTPIRLLPVGYHYRLPAKRDAAALSLDSQHITEHAFLALLSAKVDPTLDPTEHDAWDWFTYKDALMWLRWPEDIEALKRCERLINPGQPDARP